MYLCIIKLTINHLQLTIMILFARHFGELFYLIPVPFIATGKCGGCGAGVLLLGLNIGNYILTMQIHTHKYE
jgi:hypothetical protein